MILREKDAATNETGIVQSQSKSYNNFL
jgi:hypothetical protein